MDLFSSITFVKGIGVMDHSLTHKAERLLKKLLSMEKKLITGSIWET
jgi:hypothetical protein